MLGPEPRFLMARLCSQSTAFSFPRSLSEFPDHNHFPISDTNLVPWTDRLNTHSSARERAHTHTHTHIHAHTYAYHTIYIQLLGSLYFLKLALEEPFWKPASWTLS